MPSAPPPAPYGAQHGPGGAGRATAGAMPHAPPAPPAPPRAPPPPPAPPRVLTDADAERFARMQNRTGCSVWEPFILEYKRYMTNDDARRIVAVRLRLESEKHAAAKKMYDDKRARWVAEDAARAQLLRAPPHAAPPPGRKRSAAFADEEE